MKKLIALFIVLALAVGLCSCADVGIIVSQDGPVSIYEGDSGTQIEIDFNKDLSPKDNATEDTAPLEPAIPEDGWYYSAADVALYLNTYGHLPDNFITKSEARKLGWNGGSVEDYAPGYAIGGDQFGNREGLLPQADGRQYYECDIDTNGYGSRGSRRIVFSNDGLIYYTSDHYESFTLLYGEG